MGADAVLDIEGKECPLASGLSGAKCSLQARDGYLIDKDFENTILC